MNEKRPYGRSPVGSIGLLYPWDSENTLQLKDLSDSWDEHQLPIIRWVRIDVLNELDNCFTHQIGLIDLIGVADGGHLVFEKGRKTKTGLVVVFLHMHFLSSFWIRVIIRFTVSSILFPFGLLDGVLFLSPNRVLSLELCWSFFIGCTPVQQSLQEYLGVLVDDSVEWISGNILKIGSRVKSWLECLEGVISGHTEPVSGNSMPSLSPVTPETYAIRETILTKYYHAYG